ncbi:hypothetical protein PMSD_04895 [Paenibacillus macquariensis subsp. defensor]|nr:hypothetical protein PMSD_04895 [Paenibacillus macquariensis subsp. defensor]
MFKWFKRKDRQTVIVRDTSIEDDEKEDYVVKYPDLEGKIVFRRGNKEIPFPEKYEDQVSGKTIYFNKDKYFQAAQKTLELSKIEDKINRIEIVSDLDGAGECKSSMENDRLHITIRVASNKLGVMNSGYISEYDESQCKIFCEVLSHELVHAKDSIEIVSKYGINEYKSIIEEKVSNFAWIILGEYSACKKTAERYNSFHTDEQINIDMAKSNIVVFLMDQGRMFTPVDSLYYLNYAIATRVAHADVSEDQEKYLQVLNVNEERYISSMRELFNKYYGLQPLNSNQYKELGNNMISEFLTLILGMNHKEVVYHMPKFLED